MKVVSLVYQYVKLRKLDDWLAWESQQEEEKYLTQDEIRHLNSDFNYKHYSQFYEKIEEGANDEDLINDGLIDKEEEKKRHSEVQSTSLSKNERKDPFYSGLYSSISEQNIFYQMWSKAKVEE